MRRAVYTLYYTLHRWRCAGAPRSRAREEYINGTDVHVYVCVAVVCAIGCVVGNVAFSRSCICKPETESKSVRPSARL